MFNHTPNINQDFRNGTCTISSYTWVLIFYKKKLAPSAQLLQQDEWAAHWLLSKQPLITQNTSAGK